MEKELRVIIVDWNGSVNSSEGSIVNNNILIVGIVETTSISNLIVIVNSVCLIDPVLFWASNSPFSIFDWVCSVGFESGLSKRIIVVRSDDVLMQ